MNCELLIFIVLLSIVLYTESTEFLLILIGVVLYYKYIYKQRMIENYTNDNTNLNYATFSDPRPFPEAKICPPKMCESKNIVTSNRFCNDDRKLNTDQRYISVNQALVGKANPLTNVAPVIVAPISAYDYWGESYVVPRGVNDETNYDASASGYITQSDQSPPIIENYNCSQKYNQSYTTINPMSVKSSSPMQANPNPTDTSIMYPDLKEKTWINEKGTVGDMIAPVYNPKQLLEHKIPSNFMAGQCMMTPQMNEYNEQLFTSTIEPKVYHQTQVVEPIQSNLGISFQQQFEPVSKRANSDGSVTYISRDPRIVIEQPYKLPVPPTANISNIYDPRSGGYGTSYRAYTDPMSGRTRYMYDDINAIRNPNYLVRSNIDHNSWADAYGPMEYHEHKNRAMANAQFIDHTSTQRQELQERYMRKVNNQVLWQRRMAPINTYSSSGQTYKK